MCLWLGFLGDWFCLFVFYFEGFVWTYTFCSLFYVVLFTRFWCFCGCLVVVLCEALHVDGLLSCLA